MWKHRGQQRPDFAIEPGPGQESVWDYPRPPALVTSSEIVEVHSEFGLLARSNQCLRILETASPPTYYLPAAAIDWEMLTQTPQSSACEWKGRASYFALANGRERRAVAWLYAHPAKAFAEIHGHASFYPGRVACFVDGERVRPQPGEFYGGWITRRIVGPFKGEPGTGHW